MKLHALPLLIALFAVPLSGCGSSSGGKPESIASDQQVEDMVAARKIYDEAAGNWNSLASEKRTQYTKLVGGKDAEGWWKKMGTPMGGGAGPSGGGR